MWFANMLLDFCALSTVLLTGFQCLGEEQLQEIL